MRVIERAPVLDMRTRRTHVGGRAVDAFRDAAEELNLDRDWKIQNTDFYHYQLVNLVDEPIELRALHFRLKTGRGGRIYDTKGVDAIETELGGSVIQPHQFLERHNSWVFGKASQNTLHKIYEAYVGSERLRVDVPLVFSR